MIKLTIVILLPCNIHILILIFHTNLEGLFRDKFMELTTNHISRKLLTKVGTH